MSSENSVESSLNKISQRKEEINSSVFVDDTISKSKVFFWEKWAFSGDSVDDKLNSYELDDDPKIREVIKNFESRIIGKKILFSDIKTKNPSIKDWIEKIRDSYPKKESDIVEYLLNDFRTSLRTASKEKYKYIVGILLLHNTMLLIHSKKESSLAELKDESKDEIRTVDIVLHPKNVLRTAIIKNENGKTTFSVFENSRRLRKGHADFWGIEPEDVSWDSLGNIFLTIELSNFKYPIQLPIDSEQLGEMIKNKRISPRGKIRIGKEEGIITKAEVFKRYMDFNEFYDFYITEKEKLEGYRKKFKEILKTTLDDFEDFSNSEDKYKYKEDIDKIFEITPEGENFLLEKKHPRYTICFFTKIYPRILPSDTFIFRLYDAIFENNRLEIWHAGEETSHEPITIGSLCIYNKIEVNRDIIEFSNKLLGIIQDSKSKKESLFLQEHFCNFWKLNTKNKHLSTIFDFIIESINKDLEYEFENEGIFAKEIHLEFKSADDVSAKPGRFAQTISDTVKGYIGEDGHKRLCILYGFEDNGEILPLYNRFKNDNASIIEKIANEILKEEKVQLSIQPIPFKEGKVAAVFIIPQLNLI